MQIKEILFSSQRMLLDVAEKICDRVAVINQGKLLFCGKLDEMKAHFKAQGESLEKIFLDMTEHE